jgi:hypothetical protein
VNVWNDIEAYERVESVNGREIHALKELGCELQSGGERRRVLALQPLSRQRQHPFMAALPSGSTGIVARESLKRRDNDEVDH